jgi:hypothetical protein
MLPKCSTGVGRRRRITNPNWHHCLVVRQYSHWYNKMMSRRGLFRWLLRSLFAIVLCTWFTMMKIMTNGSATAIIHSCWHQLLDLRNSRVATEYCNAQNNIQPHYLLSSVVFGIVTVLPMKQNCSFIFKTQEHPSQSSTRLCPNALDGSFTPHRAIPHHNTINKSGSLKNGAITKG